MGGSRLGVALLLAAGLLLSCSGTAGGGAGGGTAAGGGGGEAAGGGAGASGGGGGGAEVDAGAPDAGELPDAGGPDAGELPDAGGPDAGELPDAGGTDGGPSQAARQAAASATALQHPRCVAVAPFYWEVGDQAGALASGSVVTDGGTRYQADTVMAIASATKWLYSTYWVQRTDGGVSDQDVKFLTFWSGYTDFTGCPALSTVGSCLDVVHLDGTTNGTFEPATEDHFLYGGGHMQKHAALNGLADLGAAALGQALRSQLGADLQLTFAEPQLAGGAVTSAAEYAKVLRRILSGELKMRSLLGTHPVCTDPSTCPTALGSPGPPGEPLHYSLGHWVEDQPDGGDGAFSSAGAFGFYPWIDASRTLYGVLARRDTTGRSGVESLYCGRLIRQAWVTGVAPP